MPTHQVTNQVPPLQDFDLLACDPALAAGLAAAGAVPGPALLELGRLAGRADIIDSARLADRHRPVLATHDRTGHRLDEVEFHPAWHRLMGHAVALGLGGRPWSAAPGPMPHLQRAAGFHTWTQAEAGHLCPMSMTYAAVPALRQEPALARQFEAGLTSSTYEPGSMPPSTKSGLLAGMSMTEKQGGSDVRSGTTVAVRSADDGANTYRLTGHKWFTSAPMNDLFLVLARAPEGLTCFLLPRILPDGTRNSIALQRLKDKLGNHSNASAEIEYDGATGWRVGDEGRGVAVILRMVTMTRLDCVLGSSGGLRAALSQATHHAAHRSAFGRRLVDHSEMTAVLADLAVQSWAATLAGLRLAAAVDNGEDDLLRLALPACKFWVCKTAVPAVAEAMECLGGNGYVEESVMPRLFRESPLNGIWEGSGTVTALDALRAVTRDQAPGAALLAELDQGIDAAARREYGDFEAGRERLGRMLLDPTAGSARSLASLAARMFEAAQLIRHGPEPVAQLYCRTRLGGTGARVLGELPSGAPTAAIVGAVTPQL